MHFMLPPLRGQSSSSRMRRSNKLEMSRTTANIVALSLCLLFVLVGSLWIWRPGIQQDEALFAAGIYPPFFRENCVRIFKQEFPLMVMTYVGTPKAMFYRFLVL